MTRSVAKIPRVAEQCDVNIHSLIHSNVFSNAPSVRSGCGTLVVKVTNSWMACYKLEPHTAKDPMCRGGRCPLNLWGIQLSLITRDELHALTEASPSASSSFDLILTNIVLQSTTRAIDDGPRNFEPRLTAPLFKLSRPANGRTLNLDKFNALALPHGGSVYLPQNLHLIRLILTPSFFPEFLSAKEYDRKEGKVQLSIKGGRTTRNLSLVDDSRITQELRGGVMTNSSHVALEDPEGHLECGPLFSGILGECRRRFAFRRELLV
ncbi:hypothetical protein TNCV_3554641 [Trichonephila clavipes]|nr:hypothetical protein TNCV_3554641 [Trichonephila clavipes]